MLEVELFHNDSFHPLGLAVLLIRMYEIHSIMYLNYRGKQGNKLIKEENGENQINFLILIRKKYLEEVNDKVLHYGQRSDVNYCCGVALYAK